MEKKLIGKIFLLTARKSFPKIIHNKLEINTLYIYKQSKSFQKIKSV